MSTRDRTREIERAALQTTVEIARGLDIVLVELLANRPGDALATLHALRALCALQESCTTDLIAYRAAQEEAVRL